MELTLNTNLSCQMENGAGRGLANGQLNIRRVSRNKRFKMYMENMCDEDNERVFH